MIAADLMTKDPVTVQSETTLGRAAEALFDSPFRHLPILRGTALVGIISDRDLRSLSMPRHVDQEALEGLKARYDQPVSTLMCHDVVNVDPETNLADIVDVMLEHKVGAVPVVAPSTGELVGIISYVDVLRAVQDKLGDI